MLVAAGLAARPRAADAAPSPPTASITSPTSGATVKGTVAIAATATAAAGDHITSIDLYDGVNFVHTISCQNQQTCSGSANWAATGLSGQHTLTAVAHANAGGSTRSAGVTVTVVTPAPAVTISSPAANSTVAGLVSIAVSAATDPALDDYPTSIDVFDGVNFIHTISCQGQQTCQGQTAWNATGLTGIHQLSARVHTNTGASATAALNVNVISPGPTVRIVTPAPGAPLGHTLIVRATGATDPSQVDHPTSIDIYDGDNFIGSFGCQGQQTCAGSVAWNSSGLRDRHTLYAVIHTDTGRSARSAPVAVGVPIRRRLSGGCALSTHVVARHHAVHGRCRIHGVPNGTRVTVQVRLGNNWATVLSGRAHAGQFTFTVHGSKRGRFDLYALVSATATTRSARFHIGLLQIV